MASETRSPFIQSSTDPCIYPEFVSLLLFNSKTAQLPDRFLYVQAWFTTWFPTYRRDRLLGDGGTILLGGDGLRRDWGALKKKVRLESDQLATITKRIYLRYISASYLNPRETTEKIFPIKTIKSSKL